MKVRTLSGPRSCPCESHDSRASRSPRSCGSTTSARRDSNAHSSAHLEEPAQLRGCPRRPQKNDAATLSVLRDAKTHGTRGLWVLEPARLSFLRDVEDEKARTDDPGVQGVMRL